GEAADPLGVKQRIGNCTYTENPEYVETMIDLINKTRQEAGLKVLTVNEQLTEAAQAHSLDMACSGSKFLEHKGSDGSWTGERLASVGYTNTYYFELLGVGLAQDALHEWSRHEDQWPAVIDPYVIEVGVGYAYSKFSRYGGYWTVIVGGP
ncbi:MAG TPA: CAP domain-containing protein, partial [Anaerolineales bacterium]|nr:CAP domain-containing protein [Anaerolineales bacterium]